MKRYSEDCSLCKVMRSMAFSGLGMGVGAGGAYLLGAGRQDMVYAGIVVAAMVVFGFLGRKTKS
ncbi:hypothetical protein NP590_02740 [Methylomonas sp. SURF-2]|uniref:DUF4536 domain-containing protein n=1 Tax=Methylomonas subterranea TaxID=2952225 RepID=A0ABT1TC20_9GAMM|nr:hypothetical protein [Methylomonas sp. SURF-2]MCQ8103012.1 hypothetical protein [Methylomonas sp. SURF-2]